MSRAHNAGFSILSCVISKNCSDNGNSWPSLLTLACFRTTRGDFSFPEEISFTSPQKTWNMEWRKAWNLVVRFTEKRYRVKYPLQIGLGNIANSLSNSYVIPYFSEIRISLIVTVNAFLPLINPKDSINTCNRSPVEEYFVCGTALSWVEGFNNGVLSDVQLFWKIFPLM